MNEQPEDANAGSAGAHCSAELYLLHKITDPKRWDKCDGPRDSEGRRCRDRASYWWENKCAAAGEEWTEPYYICEKHLAAIMPMKRCSVCLPNTELSDPGTKSMSAEKITEQPAAPPGVRCSDLLECCFCGKTDKDTINHGPSVSLAHYTDSGVYCVQCCWCGANGPVCDNSQQAVAEWNKASRQQSNTQAQTPH